MNARRPRIVVMVSGNGSNLQAILDACEHGWLSADVVGVVSNKGGVPAITRAERGNVPTIVVEALSGEVRETYDTRLLDVVSGFSPDLIVLAGFMRILSNTFLILLISFVSIFKRALFLKDEIMGSISVIIDVRTHPSAYPVHSFCGPDSTEPVFTSSLIFVNNSKYLFVHEKNKNKNPFN